ncbi:unnamed protein product [Cuscuta epithymum]|uniref:Longin domain-containing protein n=1 Tax=Cuscuta epithymum TaxID=186058 RepID=A0AAV0C1T4_9ASTE|nr:unnamed protein product [Cuscuta epithymum]CAH9123459.1 unnamed protein product [Cuscuta epithymum]
MISDPRLVHYACVAKDATVLAEFNSNDADLGALAVGCLEKTPPFHSIYTHTVRRRTYTFLIESPFVYFAVFDEKLDKYDGVDFLKAVKEGFEAFVGGRSAKKCDSHCFQGEFNPVFHNLLASMAEREEPPPLSPRKMSHESSGSTESLCGYRTGTTPLFNETTNYLKKKKKKRLLDGENDDASELSREFSVPMHKSAAFSGELGYQRAKRVWKRHVWVVLALDLIVCIILFIIWLWVCRGLKCIDG